MHTIIRPIITEKSIKDAQNGRYTFEVAKDAEKPAIRQSVHDTFSVDVLEVHTSIVKGGRKKVGKRKREVTIGAWKKATVRLKEGQKINLFDIGEKK